MQAHIILASSLGASSSAAAAVAATKPPTRATRSGTHAKILATQTTTRRDNSSSGGRWVSVRRAATTSTTTRARMLTRMMPQSQRTDVRVNAENDGRGPNPNDVAGTGPPPYTSRIQVSIDDNRLLSSLARPAGFLSLLLARACTVDYVSNHIHVVCVRSGRGVERGLKQTSEGWLFTVPVVGRGHTVPARWMDP